MPQQGYNHQTNGGQSKNPTRQNSSKQASRSRGQKGKKPRRHRGIIATLWILFASVIIGIFVFLFLIYNGVIGYMPPVEELKNPTDRFASVLYSSDGKENRPLLRRYGQPCLCRFRRSVATRNRRTDFNRRRTLRGSFRYRHAWSRTCARQNRPYGKQECRWRLNSHPAARQAALFAQQFRSSFASNAEAHRMDDSRQARTLLFEGGNHKNVSQPV